MDCNITTFAVTSLHNPNTYVLNGKIMLCSVIILFFILLILVCFHSYTRWLFHRSNRRRRLHHNFFPSITTTMNHNNISIVPHQALDPSILRAIPTFTYSTTSHKRQLECAVCLSEFEDDEKGRVLPICNHSFHVDCIDMWFQSHSSCPLCREPVQHNASVLSSTIPAEEVVSENRPAGSVVAREEGEAVCSSSSLPHVELVGVLVEMPIEECRGLDDMGLASIEASGFRSPGNPVFALKRIWST